MPGRRKSSIAAEMSIKANIAGKSAPPPTKADEPVKKSTGTGKGKAKKGKKVHVLREEEVDDLEEEEDDMGGESMSRAKGVGSKRKRSSSSQAHGNTYEDTGSSFNTFRVRPELGPTNPYEPRFTSTHGGYGGPLGSIPKVRPLQAIDTNAANIHPRFREDPKQRYVLEQTLFNPPAPHLSPVDKKDDVDDKNRYDNAGPLAPIPRRASVTAIPTPLQGYVPPDDVLYPPSPAYQYPTAGALMAEIQNLRGRLNVTEKEIRHRDREAAAAPARETVVDRFAAKSYLEVIGLATCHIRQHPLMMSHAAHIDHALTRFQHTETSLLNEKRILSGGNPAHWPTGAAVMTRQGTPKDFERLHAKFEDARIAFLVAIRHSAISQGIGRNFDEFAMPFVRIAADDFNYPRLKQWANAPDAVVAQGRPEIQQPAVVHRQAMAPPATVPRDIDPSSSARRTGSTGSSAHDGASATQTQKAPPAVKTNTSAQGAYQPVFNPYIPTLPANYRSHSAPVRRDPSPLRVDTTTATFTKPNEANRTRDVSQADDVSDSADSGDEDVDDDRSEATPPPPSSMGIPSLLAAMVDDHGDFGPGTQPAYDQRSDDLRGYPAFHAVSALGGTGHFARE